MNLRDFFLDYFLNCPNTFSGAAYSERTIYIKYESIYPKRENIKHIKQKLNARSHHYRKNIFIKNEPLTGKSANLIETI